MTESVCAWCGRPFERRPGPGRPRRYCRASCRQRDYEARSRSAELGLNEGELVVTRAELDGLRDRLYVLACAVEDAQRDLAEAQAEEAGDDPDVLRRVLVPLLDAARSAATG